MKWKNEIKEMVRQLDDEELAYLRHVAELERGRRQKAKRGKRGVRR